jgi:hypothetical protein
MAAVGEHEDAPAAPVTAKAWPNKMAEQIAAVRDVVTSSPRAWSVEDVAQAFTRARRSDVDEVLDSYAALGLVVTYETTRGRRWRVASKPTG